MIAKTVESSISMILLFIVVPALFIVSIFFQMRNRRREETLVRQWCDARGYAINRMKPVNTSLFSIFAHALLGPLIGWLSSQRGWELNVYDDEGGERNLVLRVHRRGLVEETWA